MWKCSVSGCQKFYHTPSSVRTHYRKVHSKQFRHYCSECDFGHDEMSFLKKHMHKYHGIENDLQCTKCHHVFSQKNKLIHHLTLCGHKSKTIICPDQDCSRGFRSKRSLKNHMEAKHPKPGQNPARYGCSVPGCGKVYEWKDELKKHQKEEYGGMCKQKWF